MIILRILKLVLLLPVFIGLIIYFMILWIKNEYYNNDFIGHELNKVYNGDDYVINQISKQIKYTINTYKIHLYIISILLWTINIIRVYI